MRSNPVEPTDNPPRSTPRRVLLVGWEGADWNVIQPLVDAGEMPNLDSLIESGVMGNISSMVPMVCPLLWTSIATGVFADRHNILTAGEPDGRGSVRAVRSTSRRRKALWNILSQNGLRSAVIGWPVTYPVESVEGVVVSDRFLRSPGAFTGEPLDEESSIHPPELQAGLGRLLVHPDEINQRQLRSFVPRLDEIDLGSDRRIPAIAMSLARAASVQKVATWAAQEVKHDLMAVYYGILGGLNRGFMRYHPPRDDAIDKVDSELYGGVINTGYRFLDMMLGRLMKLAGPETLIMIVSDHGFRKHRASDIPVKYLEDLTSDPSLRYHGRDAFFCVAGPGVRSDELVFGARLVDVAPTILAYMDLPVPCDMDGRVISRIFETAPDQQKIESYESVDNQDSRLSRELTEDPWVSSGIIENLSALGLVDLNPETAASLEACGLERLLNKAQTFAIQGRFTEAIEGYRAALDRQDSLSVRLPYIECLFHLGYLDEADRQISVIEAAAPDAPVTRLLQARSSIERGDRSAAEDYLDQVRSTEHSSTGTLLHLGWLALRLLRFEQSSIFFKQILEADPDCAQAHDGLGMALLRSGRLEESVYHHTQSIRLLHHRSAAHEHLGESLVATKQLDWAHRAFSIAVELDPNNKRAKKWLARVEDLLREQRGGGRE